ncbi:NYN domain-containing protein [Bombilactobacillus thymidiniphilus]|uniref:NYN domain-containing protein n=1 Tax=Bombilactobacillus thymidiniphilus TaxID=2923363 RepID=A0ABY4PEL4_9LACO|nr:NYN domain-containing protein [Bombilactobacillus thymidiniphilus]UQS83946.1 NYN domain-containing protein [Bombilactobacillus thymidiniphilus]
MKKQILIVDGYNVIGTWPKLKQLKKHNRLEEARDQLLATLANYRKFFEGQVIVVFDAMYVPGIKEQFKKWDLDVIFTAEDVTADTYIQNLSNELNLITNQVTVVTSDQAVQWTVFARGASRLPSYELYKRIQEMEKELHDESQQRFNQDLQRNIPWGNDQLKQLEKLRDQLSSDS